MAEFINLILLYIGATAAFILGLMVADKLYYLNFSIKGKTMKKLIKNIVLGVLLAYLAIVTFNILKEYRYQQLENKYKMCIAR